MTASNPRPRRPAANGRVTIGNVTCTLDVLVRFAPDGALSGCGLAGAQRVRGLELEHAFDGELEN